MVVEEVPNQETGTVRILALTDTQTGTAEATTTTTVEHSQPGDTLTLAMLWLTWFYAAHLSNLWRHS